ncbi:MAG TPA: ATP-binding protein [Pirellulales bacterium]|nr:ATP-binding protein [Pirellulales bacterium]
MAVAAIDCGNLPFDRRRPLRRYTVAAFSCLAAALACILVLGVWGAVRDLKHRQTSLFGLELAEVKSHAARTVRYIEGLLADGTVSRDFSGLPVIAHWQKTILTEEKWTHAAVENLHGVIVAHSNPGLVGMELTGPWYERVVTVPGSDVVETRFGGLTEGRPAYDVRLPIVLGGEVVGTYHSGLSKHWFERSVTAERQYALFGWYVVVSGTVLVLLLAVGALYLITRQAAALQHRLDQADLRRVTELSQFIAGLAHEVRNPLNAIRLNLHAIGRVHRGEARLPDDEVETTIRESVREIGRVAALIHEMLGYARDEPPCVENIDLGSEVCRTLGLVKQVMEDDHVAVAAHLPGEPLWVRIDRARLRQILLNLLNNSREAVGKGGRIEIGLARSRGLLELAVSDNGPGVPQAQRQRIFEPFFSTKDVGIGLGLTLVKKFVDESGGSIVYEPGPDSGGRFLVRLPEAAEEVIQEAT